MTRRAFAQEDADLGTNSVPISRKSDYKDIDLTLAVKPTSGDFYSKTNAAAVKQSIKNLLMTNRLEKPFRPEFGADIRRFLFELMSDTSDFYIKRHLASAIRRSEPRARIMNIEVYNLENYKNTVDVTVTFKIINSPQVFQVTTNLARLR